MVQILVYHEIVDSNLAQGISYWLPKQPIFRYITNPISAYIRNLSSKHKNGTVGNIDLFLLV